MNEVRLSKAMSLALRHDPARFGIALDHEGWVSLSDLVDGLNRAGVSTTRADVEQVVRTSDKRRFTVESSTDRIRANQGHSLPSISDWYRPSRHLCCTTELRSTTSTRSCARDWSSGHGTPFTFRPTSTPHTK